MLVKVNGKFYDYFNDVTISTSLASVASTFTFFGKYDKTNPEHRELFRPLSYHKVQFYDENRLNERNGGLLSTGTILQHSFNSDQAPDLCQLSGYSTSGIIEDCQVPISSYPLESNNRTLKQIASRLCGLLGVNLIVYDSVKKECDELIARSVATPEQTIKDYLSKIASQKNVVISHDIFGNLIMFRPVVSNKPVLSLNEVNTLNMKLEVNGQAMHSSLSSIRQPEKAKEKGPANLFDTDYDSLPTIIGFDKEKKHKVFTIGSVSTVNNPLVKGFRPSVDVLSSGTFYNTETAARNRMASELQNVVVSFDLEYFPTVSVGDVVEVINNDLFIPSKTRMVLQTTTISENSAGRKMSGTLVLPEAFTGNTPKNIFK